MYVIIRGRGSGQRAKDIVSEYSFHIHLIFTISTKNLIGIKDEITFNIVFVTYTTSIYRFCVGLNSESIHVWYLHMV